MQEDYGTTTDTAQDMTADLRALIPTLHSRIAEPLPPVDCPSWCYDGTGHLDRRHPGDDNCADTATEVKLGGYSLVAVGWSAEEETLVRDWLGVQLRAMHHGGPGRVILYHDGENTGEECDLPAFDIALTKDEALALADALRKHAGKLA